MREEMKTELDASSDAGELAFESSFKKAAIGNLPWDKLLGNRPSAGAALGPDPDAEPPPIGLLWSGLSDAHTHDSSLSPLLSMSMEADVSGRFGPGYIVADVCPERAIPFNSGGGYFNELEVYVPLFLLPEEIVRVEGRECGLKVAKESDDAKKALVKKACYPNDLTDSDKRSPTGATYRSCYSNFGFRTEHGLDSAGIGPLSERYGSQIHGAMYDVLTMSKNIAEVRAKASADLTKVCAPSCDTAKVILAAVQKQLGEGAPQDRENRQNIANDLPGYEAAVAKACPAP